MNLARIEFALRFLGGIVAALAAWETGQTSSSRRSRCFHPGLI